MRYHMCYLNMGAVYVKHYPDRIVIENPGAFPEGVNEKFGETISAVLRIQ